jgi:hypothetical protein
MMPLSLLLLAQIAGQAAPDIEIGARVQARSVTIEKKGEAELSVTTDPEGANLVEVAAPEANGRRTLRDVDVRVRAEARIADPAAPENVGGEETTEPK